MLPGKLPNFRNFGAILRILLLSLTIVFLAAYACAQDFSGAVTSLNRSAVLISTVLLVALPSLFVVSPILSDLPYKYGVLVVCGIVSSLALIFHFIYQALMPDGITNNVFRTLFSSTVISLSILGYFNWRQRALSPTVAEARLMALQARIRPHFLFNSLNTVIGLIRGDPILAERILENLSDLYRSLMAEARNLVPLSKELALARAYAEIEEIRLGDRLHIDWRIDDTAMNILVPPLILQPLVENAVYHGIEPAPRGGIVSVSVSRKNNEVILIVRNTCTRTEESARGGNRMALDNIRERLDLHFDAEARMSSYLQDDEYVVQIILPYRREHAT